MGTVQQPRPSPRESSSVRLGSLWTVGLPVWGQLGQGEVQGPLVPGAPSWPRWQHAEARLGAATAHDVAVANLRQFPGS